MPVYVCIYNAYNVGIIYIYIHNIYTCIVNVLIAATLWVSCAQFVLQTGLGGVARYTQERGYESLLTEEQLTDTRNEYHPVNFQVSRAEKCMVILLTSQFARMLPVGWFERMYPIHMVEPASR